MARTTITATRMDATAGKAIPYQSIDQVNGMQVLNTGAQVALVQAATGDSVSVKVASQPDGAGRTGDVGPIAVVGPATFQFGPYSPAVNWGDGFTNLFFDFTGLTGSPRIAVVTIGS